MTPIAHHIREGRDAVIAERLLGAGPAANPYRRSTKRNIFWQHGADQAHATIETLMRIGG